MDYETIEGNRRGSVLIVKDGFLYNKNKEGPNKIYIECTQANCKARGLIHVNRILLDVTAPHTHGRVDNEITLMKAKNTMTRRAEETPDELRAIFQDVTRNLSIEKSHLLPRGRVSNEEEETETAAAPS